MMLNIVNKKIMIFGGTGSLGKSLIGRLSNDNIVSVFSRDEAKHWTIRNEMPHRNLRFFVGDVRDANRVYQAINEANPDIVIAAAALKQVDTCELSPYESIQTNILGIKNIVEACETHAEKYSSPSTVVMISTDKACAPVNVYGMCKAISERLVTSKIPTHSDTKFIVVRYGNVLESRGSIIPLFKHQAENANAFTVTHPLMTRFVMTLDDSVDLIITSVIFGTSGDVWIPKLRSMKIIDLANIFSRRYKKPINFIGLRPGEKLHESLICEAESVRVIDSDQHYVIKPQTDVPSSNVMFDYVSDTDLYSELELETYLDDLNIFSKDMSEFLGRSIEEIRV